MTLKSIHVIHEVLVRNNDIVVLLEKRGVPKQDLDEIFWLAERQILIPERMVSHVISLSLKMAVLFSALLAVVIGFIGEPAVCLTILAVLTLTSWIMYFLEQKIP